MFFISVRFKDSITKHYSKVLLEIHTDLAFKTDEVTIRKAIFLITGLIRQPQREEDDPFHPQRPYLLRPQSG